jgi:hypothetical protein
VLKACSNVKRAAALLSLDWQTTHGILQRAVERGLERVDRGQEAGHFRGLRAGQGRLPAEERWARTCVAGTVICRPTSFRRDGLGRICLSA